MRAAPRGNELVELASRHRHEIVLVLLDADGRRAFDAAFRPLLRSAVVSDDILEYPIGEAEIEAFRRLLMVAIRVAPDLGGVRNIAEGILAEVEGSTLRSLISAPHQAAD